MATFTMMLHDVLGVDDPKDADASMIGLDEYPIWNPGYRGELNHKIIMRFWNREIGFETVQEFVHHVRRTMGEIMPYYNQLARTVDLIDNPLETLNITRKSDSATTGESTSTGESTADSEQRGSEQSESEQAQSAENVSRNVNSDHPQTRLNHHEDYATSSADAASEADSTSTGTATGSQQSHGKQRTEQDTQTTQDTTAKQSDTQRGFQGSQAALLQQFRDTIIGVDNQILNELETLFMGVWDNDMYYTRYAVDYQYPVLYNYF